MKAESDSRWLVLLGTILAVCGLIALGGCSADDVSGSPALFSEASADQTTGDQSAVGGRTGQDRQDEYRFLPRPLRSAEIPEGGVYDPVTEWFVCPPETDEHGATVVRSYAFVAEGGEYQTAYDEVLTAAIGLRFQLEAHPEHEGQSGTILARHDLLVSGLAGAEESRTWSGTMTFESEGVPPHPQQGPGGRDASGPRGPGRPPGGDDRRGGPGGRQEPGGPPAGDGLPDRQELTITEATTIRDVVLPCPLSEESWPLSGSILRENQIEGGPQGPLDQTSILTFNGSRYATLTVDGETIEIDLLDPPRPPHPPEQ